VEERPRAGVPDAHEAVGATGHDAGGVGRKRRGLHPPGAGVERGEGAPVASVPHARAVIATRGEHPPPVSAQRDEGGQVVVGDDVGQGLRRPGAERPKPQSTVGADARGHAAIGRQRHRQDSALVRRQGGPRRGGGAVPEAYRAVVAPREDRAAVAGDGQGLHGADVTAHHPGRGRGHGRRRDALQHRGRGAAPEARRDGGRFDGEGQCFIGEARCPREATAATPELDLREVGREAPRAALDVPGTKGLQQGDKAQRAHGEREHDGGARAPRGRRRWGRHRTVADA
jgi:hypothetical protein